MEKMEMEKMVVFEQRDDHEIERSVNYAKHKIKLICEIEGHVKEWKIVFVNEDPFEGNALITNDRTDNFDNAVNSLNFWRGMFACKQIYDNRLGSVENAGYKMHTSFNCYRPHLNENRCIRTFVMKVMNEVLS